MCYHVSRCHCASAVPLLRADTEAQNSPSMVNTTKFGSAGEGTEAEKQHLNVIFAEQPAQSPLLSIKAVQPIDQEVQN